MPLARSYGPTNINDYLSSVLDQYAPGVQDNIYNEAAWLYWLNRSNRKERVSGGDQKVHTVHYKKNSTVQRYYMYQTLNPLPQNNMTQAAFPWRQYGGMVMIAGMEKRNNKGNLTRLANLAMERTDDCYKALVDLLAQDFVAASPDALAIQSIDTLIGTGNVGQIDGATYTWWQSSVVSSGAFPSVGLNDLMTGYMGVWQGRERIDLLYSSKVEYQLYWQELDPRQRYVDSRTYDAGFENLKFMGATWLADDYPTAGTIWGVNSSSIQLTVHEDADFAMTPEIQPLNQDGSGKQIIVQVIFSIRNRRRNFKLTGVTQS